MAMQNIELIYQAVRICPLCNGAAIDRCKLTRSKYYFGCLSIPLPREGVFLCECSNCSLLFKNLIPKQEDLNRVMSGAATSVWQTKNGVHPALAWIKPFLKNETSSILDIGASNGDLLLQLKPFASSISALDVVTYPQCQLVVNNEYIIGEIEGTLDWSGDQYDVVTAFDIFEHFLDTSAALKNISRMVKNGGKLIIETGDWKMLNNDLSEWYYANLFEHQIFWSRKSFDFMCHKYGFSIVDYRGCRHKGRRDLGLMKRVAMELVVTLAGNPLFQRAMFAAGKGDPLRFSRPSLIDHAFVVLEKNI